MAMEKLELKYGVNPDQKDAYVFKKGGLPFEVLNGKAGYINLLDALSGWQLVKDLKKATGMAAATSFKHVSPAGAAVGLPLDDVERRMYFASGELSELASAFVRARGADRMSSFGDFIALSDKCDESTARIISKEVSDGIIAPGYDEKALEILRKKKKGAYTVIAIDGDYEPGEDEERSLFGVTFHQERNSYVPSESDFENIVTKNKNLPESARLDLIVSLVALKYTQSNSVCYAERGQTIGVGAGQQSRIHCTRLAGSKADLWHLRHSEKVLSLPFKKELSRNDKDNVIEQYLSDCPEVDVLSEWDRYFTSQPEPFGRDEKIEYLASFSSTSLSSDAFFPFEDNISRAYRSGVRYITEPGGSMRDESVIGKADELGIVMCFTSHRLFHH